MRQEARHPIAELRVIFDDTNHEYRMAVDGEYTCTWDDAERIPSVTQFVGHYEPPFQADAIAARKAAQRGCTIGEIQAEWDEASRMGTRVHANQEAMMLGRVPDQTPHSDRELAIMQAGAAAMAAILEAGWEPVAAELMVVSPSYRLAGTVDAIFKRGRERLIVDWKTNKRLDAHGYLGERMLPPVSNLENCHMSRYGLQLNLYQRILQHEGYMHTELPPRRMLVHLTPSGFVPHPIGCMPEADVLLLDYATHDWFSPEAPF